MTLRLWQALRRACSRSAWSAVYETLDRPLCRSWPRWSAGASRSTRTACGGFRVRSPSAWPRSRTGQSPAAAQPRLAQQLGEVLFDERGLEATRKTKTGATHRRRGARGARARDHDRRAPSWYRALTKLKGTYLDTLPLAGQPRTGRLHTSFRQAVAATGRLSSTDPNLQNIPIRTEVGRRIREAFVPEPGWHAGLPPTTRRSSCASSPHLSTGPRCRGVPRGRRRPRRTAAGGVRRPARRGHRRAAARRQGGQLRRRLRPERLRPRARARHPARGGRRATSHATSSSIAGVAAYMDERSRIARARGYVETHPRPPRRVPELDVKSRVAQPRRAHRPQHAHPGHRRRHHEARHGRAGAEPRVPGRAHGAHRPRRAGVRGAGGAGRRPQALVRTTMGRMASSRCRCWSRRNGASWEKAH